jgi:urease accessory protein
MGQGRPRRWTGRSAAHHARSVNHVRVIPCPAPVAQRARGDGLLRVGRAGLERLYQDGCAKVRLPRHAPGAGHDAVLINTAGGLTGGDRLSWTAEAGAGARLSLTTPACEKVYRTSEGAAQIEVRLSVESGARIDWLPQETILFDRSALSRTLAADVAAGGELLVMEAVILGRTAMGETVREGRLRDRWRIRREGRLIFADELRLEGTISELVNQAPLLAGRRAFASLLLVTEDAERSLPAVRDALGDDGGASAFDGKLFVRVATEGGFTLRQRLLPALAALRDGRPAPRIWSS